MENMIVIAWALERRVGVVSPHTFFFLLCIKKHNIGIVNWDCKLGQKLFCWFSSPTFNLLSILMHCTIVVLR